MSHPNIFNNLPIPYQFLLKILGYKFTKITYFTFITACIINTLRFIDNIQTYSQESTINLATTMATIFYVALMTVPIHRYLHRSNLNQFFQNLSDASQTLNQLGYPINYRNIRSKINRIFLLVLTGLTYKFVQNQIFLSANADIHELKLPLTYRKFFYYLDNLLFVIPLVIFHTFTVIAFDFLDQIESGIEQIIKSKSVGNNFEHKFRIFLNLFKILLESIDLIRREFALSFFVNIFLTLMFFGLEIFFLKIFWNIIHIYFNPLILAQIAQHILCLWFAEFTKNMVSYFK